MLPRNEDPRMSEYIRTLIDQRKAYYLVHPYYVLVQTHQPDGSRASRMVAAGFDVDVYGLVPDGEWQPPQDYWIGYSTACTLIQEIQGNTTDTCSIEVIPFESSVVVDTRRQMQKAAMVRIRIKQRRGLDQPAGVQEKRVLAEVEARLQELGFRPHGSAI